MTDELDLKKLTKSELVELLVAQQRALQAQAHQLQQKSEDNATFVELNIPGLGLMKANANGTTVEQILSSFTAYSIANGLRYDPARKTVGTETMI